MWSWVLFVIGVWSVAWLHNLFYFGPGCFFKAHGIRRPDKSTVWLSSAFSPILTAATLVVSFHEGRWKAPKYHIDRCCEKVGEYFENRGSYSALARTIIQWVTLITFLYLAVLLGALTS